MMQQMPPEERERLTRDALDAIKMIDTDEWVAADALDAVEPHDLINGLVIYANYLEAVMVRLGSDVEATRDACRNALALYRERAAS